MGTTCFPDSWEPQMVTGFCEEAIALIFPRKLKSIKQSVRNLLRRPHNYISRLNNMQSFTIYKILSFINSILHWCNFYPGWCMEKCSRAFLISIVIDHSYTTWECTWTINVASWVLLYSHTRQVHLFLRLSWWKSLGPSIWKNLSLHISHKNETKYYMSPFYTWDKLSSIL